MRRILVLLLVGGLILGSSSRISAHAVFVSSDPAPNASLTEAPPRVRITFTEPLELRFSDIQVLGTDGRRLDASDLQLAQGDDTTISVGLQSPTSGLYTVSWKAYSTVDGHLTTGAYTFGVGVAVPTSAAPVSEATVSTESFPFLEAGIRWLNLLTAFVLVGGFAFRLLVLGALRRNAQASSLVDTIELRVLRITWLAAPLALLGIVLAAVQQGARGSGLPFIEGFSPDVLAAMLSTRFGSVLLARLAIVGLLAGLITALLLLKPRIPLGRTAPSVELLWAAGLIAGMAMQLTTSLNSHSAALTSGAAFAVAVDWVHLCAAAFWVGGLTQLVLSLIPSVWRVSPSGRAPVMGMVIPRFSLVGLGSVVLLALTGAVLTVEHLPGLRDLVDSAYGRTLSIKLLLIVPLLILAAGNLLYVRPRLLRFLGAVSPPVEGANRILGRFRFLVRWETNVVVVVIGAAAVLTSFSPARSATGQPTDFPLIFQDHVGPYAVKLTVSPGRIGVNTFVTEVTTHEGAPITDLRRVTLTFRYLDQELGESVIEMVDGMQGRYESSGSNLSVVGKWEIKAEVQAIGQEPATASYRLDVSDSGTQGPATLKNPIPATQPSISRGRDLFMVNCAACHGTGGRGDGPAGANLEPKPANLTEHAQEHPDGEVFGWISSGKGQGMPSFAGALTEEERWHLVNFVKNGLK